MANCPKCGAELKGNFCGNCGYKVEYSDVHNEGTPAGNNYYVNNTYNTYNAIYSDKNWLVCLLLCIFVGGLGIHRFYAGKIGTGVIWLLTGGCCGIGALVDLIMIACGSFKDSYGRTIKAGV